ncbi:MAG: hypothetical protein CM1200mP31_6640 [Candidatus Neomarinimicrobiota bacterium]|nr:MAG: hypothetical protein CM1200mP31_6640 [Candidatus Neomarinimicrobiota bacterium]
MTSSDKLNYRLFLVFCSFLAILVFYYWQSPYSNEILLTIQVLCTLALVAFGLPIFFVLAALSQKYFFCQSQMNGLQTLI